MAPQHGQSVQEPHTHGQGTRDHGGWESPDGAVLALQECQQCGEQRGVSWPSGCLQHTFPGREWPSVRRIASSQSGAAGSRVLSIHPYSSG